MLRSLSLNAYHIRSYFSLHFLLLHQIWRISAQWIRFGLGYVIHWYGNCAHEYTHVVHRHSDYHFSFTFGSAPCQVLAIWTLNCRGTPGKKIAQYIVTHWMECVDIYRSRDNNQNNILLPNRSYDKCRKSSWTFFPSVVSISNILHTTSWNWYSKRHLAWRSNQFMHITMSPLNILPFNMKYKFDWNCESKCSINTHIFHCRAFSL